MANDGQTAVSCVDADDDDDDDGGVVIEGRLISSLILFRFRLRWLRAVIPEHDTGDCFSKLK